jgi:hypothetical protein
MYRYGPCRKPPHVDSPRPDASAVILRHQPMRGGSASVNAMALIYTERLELSCAFVVVKQSACDIDASQTQDTGSSPPEATI